MSIFLARLRSDESGQTLILMAIIVPLVFLAGFLAYDIGMWFSGRASVINATDSATMAGSLQLPLNGAAAQTEALAYLQDNDPDIDIDDVTISFRCIVGDRDGNGVPDPGDIPAVCPQLTAGAFTCIDGLCYAFCSYSSANAKCNTIVTQAEKDVPFAFGPFFGIAGGDGAGYTSAACRGACGGPPTLPLDIVMVLDRTGSMSSTDLNNAKNAARAVLQIFNPEVQHIALGVLGPSSTTSTCTGSNAGGRGIAASSTTNATWLPVGLSNDYQSSFGVLNTNSLLVKTINCLNNSSVGTNLGDPLKVAADYLQANGRPNVKKGIIFLSDGEATEPVEETGDLNCTANAPVTSGSGDNNGYETTPGNACANGGGDAQDLNTGTNTQTTNCGTNTGKDRHLFYDYNIALPGDATITGIDVRLDARISSTSGTNLICVQLSSDGGATWTTPQDIDEGTDGLDTSEDDYTLEGLWGRQWTPSDLTNANFRVRVTNVTSATTGPTSTAELQTSENGSYTAWSGNESDVDEGGSNPSCSSGDSVFTSSNNSRESFTISLGSIPDGSLITGVSIQTWDSAGTSATGGTYQPFARLNSTDVNTGSNIATTSTGNGCTQRPAQLFDLPDTVKSSSTNLQIGVLKTNGTNVRVGAIRAVVHYETNHTFYLDWVSVNVHYVRSGGPCEYAYDQAQDAKSIDPPIEIFTIAFGVNGVDCEAPEETTSSSYYNVTVTRLLADMATDSLDDGGDGPGGIGPGCDNTTEINSENADGDHFLCEARSGDLEPIFRGAAEQLAAGSRLVKLPF